MTNRPLRGQQGLRPYAAVKSLGPSALADGSYPISRDFQGASEGAALSTHNEIEDIPADAASEAVKNLVLGMNVKRGMAFGMKGAEPNVLLARSPQAAVSPSYGEEIAPKLYGFRVEPDGSRCLFDIPVDVVRESHRTLP